MKRITDFIVKYRNLFLISFIIISLFSLYISKKVNINEDIMKYLPKSSETKIGKDIMDKEFPLQDSSELNVMFENLSKKDKEVTLTKLSKIKGVSSVSYDESKNFNKGKYTLYTLNVNDYAKSKTSEKVYNTVNDNFKYKALSGSINDEYKPILKLWIVAFSIGCALIILILLSESFIEPFLYLISIGIAVFINKGTNIIFPSVSSITTSISAVLQLALSMDYSIMLSNRFKQEKRKTDDKVEAMRRALHHSFGSISSSSITTVVGLLALVFMSFTIGKDLGFVLAKGVVLSLVSIFCCLPALLLLFDNLIEKTHKKSLNLHLNRLGKYSYFTRYIQAILVVGLFIGAYLLKGNVNVLYTGSEEDEVGKVFKSNNQIALVYENKYEDFIKDYCQELEKDEKITNVLCYSNTINEKLKYNEFNDKLKSLGKDVTIDENLIKIIYYNYFNQDNLDKISLDEFINFIKSDIYPNKKYNQNITNDVKEKIELLSNFVNKDKINKKRNVNELSQIIGIDENDASKIIVYFNSKNINNKLTISEFVNFLINDVSKDKEYSSYISKDTLSKLNMIKSFTNKDLINKEMDSLEISNMLGIDKEIAEKLILFYKINNDNNLSLSINEFATFTLSLANNEEYKTMFNEEMISKLNLLNSLTKDELINQKLDDTSMTGLFNSLNVNISEDAVSNLYILIDGLNSSSKMSISTFINILSSLSDDPMYSSYFNEELNAKLLKVNNLNTYYNQLLPLNSLYDMFNINEELRGSLNTIFNNNDKTIEEFITTLISNDSIKSNLSSDQIKDLNTSLFIVNNHDTLFTNNEISNLFNLDKNISSMIYGIYDDNTNNLNKLSVKELINFIYQNKDNNLIKPYVNELIINAYNIINNSSKKFNYVELSKFLNLDESLIKKIYGLYDYNNIKVNNKVSLYNLVSIIINNKDNELINKNISIESFNNLNILYVVMNSTISNKKYLPDELSKLFNIDIDKVKLLYGLYNYKKGISNNISLYNFVNVITSDLVNNKEYNAKFNSDNITKLNDILTIMSKALNNEKYTYLEASNILSSLSDGIDKNLTELVYIYYGTNNRYNDSWTMSIEEVIRYINNDIIKDEKFNNFLSNDKKLLISSAYDSIIKSKNLLVSDKYSRIIINSKYDAENKDTYKFVNNIKNNVADKKGIYVVGNSPMAVEMSKSFNSELNRITLLTMIFIFLVVAFTFKDLIIPLILVLIIQTAVYITMSFITITGGSVYFISLIIVQAILMGATIDYAIVYTSYYKEARRKKNIKEAIISAYNKSIHTIISSSSILIIVTLVVSNFATAIAAKICETISQGTLASTILILLVLPGTLAATDRLICRSEYKKKKN